MLFLAKDEYTFTFLKGSAGTSGGATAPSRGQAGDTAYKGVLRTLEKILRDNSKESSAKFEKSLERILLKFSKVQSPSKGTPASAGLGAADAKRIAKEVASEVINQQIKQIVKTSSSKSTATSGLSESKIIQSIEKSADRQAKMLISGLNSLLSKRGVQLEDTKNLERAVSGAIKSAIPKDAGMGIKEIGKLASILKTGLGDINKTVKQMGELRKGGIGLNEIKEIMLSFKKLNDGVKQITDSTAKLGKAVVSAKGDIVGLKEEASKAKAAVSKKVTAVTTRASEDPVKFAKTTAVALSQALEKSLKSSSGYKGSELEGSVKKLGDSVKNMSDVLSRFEKIQGNIVSAVEKGQLSVDTKAIEGLSKNLGNLPKKIGGDIAVKGWKELTSGLEGFAKKVDVMLNSLKDLKLKLNVDINTKSLETKIEKAVERGITNNVKTLTKEIDSTFNKIIGEMRKMYSALPKESPIRPKLEKAGKELKAAKESGDYPLVMRNTSFAFHQ